MTKDNFLPDDHRIIISGGDGFIGGFILKKLRAVTDDIIEIYEEGPYNWENLETADFGGYKTAIFHLAGAVPTKYPMSHCYEVNRFLDSKMYALSKRLDTRFFVYASSVSVYGAEPESEVKVVSENDKRCIPHLYARSKCEMEDSLLREDYARILRVSSPYKEGNSESPGLYGRFLRDRSNITVIDPFRLQNYIEANRLFGIMAFALRNGCKIINAVSEKSITNLELGLRLSGEGSTISVKAPAEFREHGYIYRSIYYEKNRSNVREQG